MIVDSHVHIDYKADGSRYSPDEYVAIMDTAGVDISVVLGNDQADFGYKRPWTSQIKGYLKHATWHENSSFLPVVIDYPDEEVAEFCNSYPNRFVGIGSVHPDRYRPDLKVKRAIDDFGLKGIKLYPHSGFYPNDPRLDRVYEICVKRNVPVFFHTGIKALMSQRIKFNNPIYIDDVASQFPDLKIVMLHGGYPWTKEFLTVLYSNPNTWADISFMDYIEKTFFEDGLVEKTIKALVNLVGPKRIFWGSEGPFLNLPMFGKHGPEYIKQSQDYLVNRFDFLTAEDKKNILGINVSELLNLI